MKKVVIFTLAMVLALSVGSAFAFLNDNATALLGAQAATDGSKNVAVDAQGQAKADDGAQAATNGGTNLKADVKVDVDISKSFNRSYVDSFNDYNSHGIYVVDNQILTNVNPNFINILPDNTIRFEKTQSAELEGSFNHAIGVSNVNNAAGNLNNGTAFTTISVR